MTTLTIAAALFGIAVLAWAIYRAWVIDNAEFQAMLDEARNCNRIVPDYQPTEDERRVIEWLRYEKSQNEIVNCGGSRQVSAHRFAVYCDVIAAAIERGGHHNG